jgi:hypothetical protein
MKKMALVLGSILVLFFASSCVNNGDVIEGNTAEHVTAKMTVLGYGFERGASSSGTELLSKQNAIASLGEQIKGSKFTFTNQGSDVSFSIKSDATIPGMREYYKRVDRSAGKYFAVFIYGAEVEVEYPRPFGVFTKTYDESGTSAREIVNTMKVKAVRECIQEKLGGKMPSRVNGRLFITSMDLVPADNGNDVEIKAAISIVFDSVSK